MFQLEAGIAGWKRRIATTGSCTGESLDELESHLRESHASLVARGLTSEEAFLIAARRVGDPDSLQAEYAKEHPAPPVWLDRLFWMLAGSLLLQCLFVLAALLRDVGNLTAVALAGPGPAMIPLAITFTAAGFAAVGCGAFLQRKHLMAGVATRPTAWFVASILVIVAGKALSVVILSASARFATPADFSTLIVFRTIATYAFFVITLAALGITLTRLRRRLTA